MKRSATRVPEFPQPDPNEAVRPNQVRLKNGLWTRLKRVATLERRSLNEVIAFFLEWAVDDWEKSQQRKKK